MNSDYRFEGIFELELRRQVVAERAASARSEFIDVFCAEPEEGYALAASAADARCRMEEAEAYLATIDEEIASFLNDEWEAITFWLSGAGMNWDSPCSDDS